MRRYALLGAAAVLALSAAARAADRTPAAAPEAGTAGVALPDYGTWGFDLKGQDRAGKPGDSFFDYANGTAVRNMVIPPDKTRYGSFNLLTDLSEQRTHDILEKAAVKAGASPTDPVEKAGAIFRAFMDEAAVTALGAKPLAADLAKIRAVANMHDFATLLGDSTKTFNGSLFEVGIEPDAKDPTQYSITIGQAGLGMPDRDYYIAPQFADKRQAYQAFIAKMLTLEGWPEAEDAARKVFGFEQQLAQVSWARADRRDADKTYNPATPADLHKLAPGFDWPVFLAAADLGTPDHVVLGEKSAILKIAALAAATPIDTLKAWAALHLAINAAPYLSADFVDANFDFFNKALQGQPQNRPRWKRAVKAAETAMGDAIGQAYVAAYYPPEAKAKMEALTHDLRDAFHARLEQNTWMSPATREKALAKLASFDFQIGYPKKWRDYSGLSIRNDDLYGDAERSAAFEWAFQVSHLNKPTDRDQWEMFPQTVNAYNMPTFNEVVFPAAILQPPFFNPKADPAINYGAIGGVIGHEMTHSFDDQGRKYDEKGRLNTWWTEEDTARFNALADRYGKQFAAMEILPGARINPALTMGENIADLGGLTLALDAYHTSLHGAPAPVIDGVTGDQRVFYGWAQVWRMKARDAAARQLLVIDPHSPAVARVNGPVHNIDAFYSAFDVKPGDKLYLAPAERVKIW